MLNNRDFYQILAEKLKNLGMNHDHDLVYGTEFYKDSVKVAEYALKHRSKSVKEYDLRIRMTRKTRHMDSIIDSIGMHQYRAEMYDRLMQQACSAMLANNVLNLSGASRNYGNGRVFEKG